MKQTAAAIFFILALLRSAQADDPAILGQGNGLADFVVSVCGPAPQSDLCYEAESILRARVIKSLLELGASRSRERAYATVLSYVDHPEPDIRAAALAALGGLHPDAQDTALLADALNDPIPAIRSAALSSLVQSSDPATNALVDRARDDQGMSLEADPPPDRGLLGVSLPPSAEPLRFTDDAPEGVVAFVTNQSAQEILDFYSALTGQSALPLAAARQLLLPAWAATSGMAFYQELGKRMEEFGALPQEQQLSAQYRLALIMALSQEGQLPAEFDRWQDEERWGDVRVMALALDPLLEMPSQLLLVYQDRDLQRTGFALQWLPALDFPATLVPQSHPAETPMAPAEDLDRAALEQTIWEAVACSNSENQKDRER